MKILSGNGREITHRLDLVFVCLGLFISMPQVHAEDLSNNTVVFGLERFQWQEFNDNKPLLLESGSRLRLGLREHNLTRRYPGIIYDVESMIAIGRVGYEGRSLNIPAEINTSFVAATNYVSLSLAGLVGQRYGYLTANYIFDTFAGVGMDMWLRAIEGGKTNDGGVIEPLSETYRVLQAILAVGITHHGGSRHTHFRLGLKYPLAFAQWLSVGEIRLSPGKRISPFVKLTVIDVFAIRGYKITLTLHYETLRLGRSDIQIDSTDGGRRYQQPKSNMDIIGITFSF